MENIADLSPSVASLANNECGGPELLPKLEPDTAAKMQEKDAQATAVDSASSLSPPPPAAAATPATIACESKPASVETPSPDLAVPVLTERNNVMKNSGANPNRLVSPVLLKLRRKQERCNAISADTENPVLIVPPKKLSGFPAAERYMSPTDLLMSPISRGLLARSRRAMRPSPACVPPKILESTFQEAETTTNQSKS